MGTVIREHGRTRGETEPGHLEEARLEFPPEPEETTRLAVKRERPPGANMGENAHAAAGGSTNVVMESGW